VVEIGCALPRHRVPALATSSSMSANPTFLTFYPSLNKWSRVLIVPSGHGRRSKQTTVSRYEEVHPMTNSILQ
jgi:hypothetical protein